LTAHASPPPLVILGLDVGDPEWLERWASEGYLPTLASIMKRGVMARTTGPDLITEHSVWVSLISGLSVGQHGFYEYKRLKPGTYELETITGRDLDVRPFWSHVPAKRAVAIDVPHCYPEAQINGVHLTEWGSHHPYFSPSASSEELLEEIQRSFGGQIHIPEELDSKLRADREIYARALDRIEKKGALCRHLLSQESFDVAVAVFGDSHLASHQFWEYRPEHRGERKVDARDELTHAMRDVFQRIDHEMGAIIEQLPADANICVVSSTGLLDHYPTTGLIDAFCRELGYQASPTGSGRVSPMSVVRRMVPHTWRYALSRWLPQETQQRLINEKFQSNTDWSRTTAFVIPSFFTSFLRVNLAGREPCGIVEPGAEYEALLDRLEMDLKQLTNPETGESVVEDVVRTGVVFGGASTAVLPDLFVVWRPHQSYMERVVHPNGELVAFPPEIFRGSDHSRSGFVALAGPSIQTPPVGDVSLLDLAPTFLALMGESPPRELIGKPLPILARG
jgi:predicted AlkP superfamily phosphohydrolase/phosphomutase